MLTRSDTLGPRSPDAVCWIWDCVTIRLTARLDRRTQGRRIDRCADPRVSITLDDG